MSDAKVQFCRLDACEVDCAPGEEQAVWFTCPRYGHRCGPLVLAGRTDLRRDGQNKGGGVAQWDWDGSREAPTLRPSVNCSGCWHGFIEGGRCVDTSRRDEPEPPRRM